MSTPHNSANPGDIASKVLLPGDPLRARFIALGASTDSNMNHDRFGSIYFAPTASFDLLDRAYHLAMQENMKAVVANVFTSDKFYDDALDQKKKLLSAYGVAAIDMETCELYSLAAKHGIDALTIMTVSDNLIMSLKDVQPKSGRHPLTT